MPILKITDFSGGINAKGSPFTLKENECEKLVNANISSTGAISKRKGYEQRGGSVGPASSILGLGSISRPDGTNKVVAACGDDLFVYNTTTKVWDDINIGMTSGGKTEFANFLDTLFFTNYTQGMRSYDGTSFSWANCSGAPRAKYIAQYADRLFLANCVASSSTTGAQMDFPSRVYASSLQDNKTITWNKTNITTTGTDGYYFDVDTNDNDVIRGLDVNYNRLLVFKEYSLYTWDTNSLVQIRGAKGTTSNRSVVTFSGVTIYLNRDGVWLFDGTQSILISEPIRKYLEGVTEGTYYQAAAGYYDRHYICYVGDINNSDEEIVVPKACIDYDLDLGAWTVFQLGVGVKIFSQAEMGGFGET